ncbi:hypothetical protein P4O66_014059, partial [Electrophorus voltai]
RNAGQCEFAAFANALGFTEHFVNGLKEALFELNALTTPMTDWLELATRLGRTCAVTCAGGARSLCGPISAALPSLAAPQAGLDQGERYASPLLPALKPSERTGPDESGEADRNGLWMEQFPRLQGPIQPPSADVL